MATIFGDIRHALNLQGQPEMGLAGEYDGVLVYLHPKAEGGLPQGLSLSIKGVASDLPAPPPEMARLIKTGTVHHDVKTGIVALQLRDLPDDPWDGDAFKAALDAYIATLKAGGAVAKPRCSDCMETQGLSILLDQDRAVRLCPVCLERRHDPHKQTTAFMAPGYVAPRGDEQAQKSKKGCMGLLLLLALPVTAAAATAACVLA